MNFDTIALELCAEKAGVSIKKIETKVVSFTAKTNSNDLVISYEIPFKNNRCIRFWFPHGNVDNFKNITLGTREYSKRMNTIERLRKYSKSKEHDEKRGTYTETSWYHEMTHNPLLILGAEMSRDEWDLWFAIVNRERNHASNSQPNDKNLMFQMRECKSTNMSLTTWFEPLFVGLTFDEQWSELGKYFKQV